MAASNASVNSEESKPSSERRSEDSFVILWRDGDQVKELNKGSVDIEAIREQLKKQVDTDERDMNQLDSADIIEIPSCFIDITSDQVQERIVEILDENNKLKERIIENNNMMRSQYENMLALQDKAKEYTDFIKMIKKEEQNLAEELVQLKTEKYAQEEKITLLKQTVAELTQNNLQKVNALEWSKKNIEELKQRNHNLLAELEKLKSKKDAQNEEIDILKKSVVDMKERADKTIVESELYKKQIQKIELQLQQAESKSQEQHKLFTDGIRNLNNQLLLDSEKKCKEEIARLEQELGAAKVTIMHLEQNKLFADNQVNCLNAENLALQTKLKPSQTGNELQAIKSQVDLLNTDLMAEKKLNQDLSNKNSNLKEELQKLRLCCQELQEEIVVLQEFNCASDNRRQPGPDVSLAMRHSMPSSQQLLCPICNFGFRTEQALQNHVHRCLDVANNS